MRIHKQLRKNGIFSDFTDEELDLLFDALDAKLIIYQQGNFLLKKGDLIDSLFVVLKGDFVEYEIKKNGEQVIKQSYVDGDVYGIPQCFSYNNLAQTYLMSVVETNVIVIKKEDIFNLAGESNEGYKKFIQKLIIYISNEMSNVMVNNEYISLKSMRSKIAKFIYEKYLEQKSFIVKLGVDRNGMARYLNVSRPSMSREMIHMREEGIFSFTKDIITIQDIDALKKYAENAH
ncbi:MAG: Crp/Fnr family transcriptional regulator [Clostridia bacterium]|nr:Crp/Fnr family transcriptional regulator [Clostridia bacterium]